jgi:choline dehydrogenase
LHPFSRGTVAIKSADAFVEPSIDPRYGSNPLDLQIVIEGIKFQNKLITTAPMLELLPVQVAPPAIADDAALELYVKLGLQTNYHPSGTASMLPKEKGGVVDTKLLVYGTANLRVVDGGMIPLLPGCHIGAAVYAVAEKVRSVHTPSYMRLTIILRLLISSKQTMFNHYKLFFR